MQYPGPKWTVSKDFRNFTGARYQGPLGKRCAPAAAATTQVRALTRRKPARQPFRAHLARERVIVPGPTACACCGSTRRQAGRGRHRHAESNSSPVEGGAARTREVQLPRLREDQPGAGTPRGSLPAASSQRLPSTIALGV